MDKQQFDNIDNRIRQAADEISFSFNEEAWNRMVVKLDNEFKKEHRRGFIWWWFSLLLLGITALSVYIHNTTSQASSKQINTVSTSAKFNSSINKNADLIKAKPLASNDNSFKAENKKVMYDKNFDSLIISSKDQPARLNTSPQLSKRSVVKFDEQNNNNTTDSVSLEKSIRGTGKRKIINSIVSSPKTGRKKTNTEMGLDKTSIVLNNNEFKVNKNNSDKPFENLKKSSIQINPVADSLSANSSTAKKVAAETLQKNASLLIPDSAGKKKTPIKLHPSSSRGLYFLASIAADATDIKSISVKQSKPLFGVGIGYGFNKRLSVQTGFYFGKKVYNAGPDDYKVKEGSYIAKIIRADAQCYIYDIPFTIRYDAFHQKKLNLYFTTGLSSYILKRETYDIHFFNPMGSYKFMSYTYTHNVNYLSVFNLSIGYDYKVSESLNILAEPYLKLPLAGLGEGSVKLYSAGLQVGIKYQPLKKK